MGRGNWVRRAEVDALFDEIEGLRTQVSHLERCLETVTVSRDQCRAEIDRLMATLSGNSSAPGVFCPKCGNEGPPCACPVVETSDSDRLNWIFRNVSGAEWRRLGIIYSAGMTRTDLDRAIALTYVAICAGGSGGPCTQPDCEQCWPDEPSALETSTPHSVEDDFQHWLSYTGGKGDLRQAFYAGRNTPPPSAPVGDFLRRLDDDKEAQSNVDAENGKGD